MSIAIDELLSIIINALEDVKGQDIRVYDTSKKTSAFERVVVCSGTSNRQTKALAQSVARAVKSACKALRGIEGTETGEWVLVDCSRVVVHCMQPQIRQYYNLEELYGPEKLDMKTFMEKTAAKAAKAAKAEKPNA